MSTLYELTNEYADILAQCDDDNEDVIERLNAIESDIESKVKNGIGLIQTLTRRIENYDAEIKRLIHLKKATENNVERIKQNYIDNLKYIGKTKVVTSLGTMTVARAGGKRKMVIDDENLIPADFKFTRYEEVVDKDSLRDSLENGELIEGVHLEERQQYLKIS